MVSKILLPWATMPKYTCCFAITLLGLLCLIPVHAKAAPQITGVSGTATHRNAMTITGVAFGAGDTTPITYDDFESGTVGQTLSGTPLVGAYVAQDQPTPIYSSTYHHSGTKSSYGEVGGGNMYTGVQMPNNGVDYSHPLTDTFYYASWWGYWHANCSQPGQVKLIQLWGNAIVQDYDPGVFHGGGSATYIALEDSGVSYASSPWAPPANPDGWHQYQMVLKQSDINVANGQVVIILDGVTIYNPGAVITRQHAGKSWNTLKPHEGMTNQSGCADANFYALDDVYLNNSWARVVLGNKSTYAASTSFDVQPVDWTNPAWSDTGINIRVNTGAYTNGQTAYLYVVDATGAVNANGFAVTIASGAGGGTTPPAAPVNLRVQ